jgi:hypothetical protein
MRNEGAQMVEKNGLESCDLLFPGKYRVYSKWEIGKPGLDCTGRHSGTEKGSQHFSGFFHGGKNAALLDSRNEKDP